MRLLPFKGNKSNKMILNKYEEILKEITKNKKIKYIVDVFGGSGILSIKSRDVLGCEGFNYVYNDYDNYSFHVKNVKYINECMHELREKIKSTGRLTEEEINTIREIIEKFNIPKYLYGAWFGYSGKIEIKFNRLPQRDYKESIINAYDNINIIHADYKDIIKEHMKHNEEVLFILDPPYLYSDNTTYGNGEHVNHFFNLADYIELLKYIKKMDQYILFIDNDKVFIKVVDLVLDNEKIMKCIIDNAYSIYGKGSRHRKEDIILYYY